MKKGRTEIFAQQDAQRRRTLDERQATINTARATAQAALQEAKKGIAAEVQAARVELERSSGTLATDIAEAILAGAPSGPGSSQGKGAR
jgi:F0F1-type ATP synthase membrane subunit b/b'